MISRRSSSASGSRGAGRLLARAAAVAVTCASLALSGSMAAEAAAGTAKKPRGGEPTNQQVVLPRLDSTNIITGFTLTLLGVLGVTVPTASTVFTGSARRGHVFVNDGTAWRDVTSVFPEGYYYDITLAPSPAEPINLVGGVLPTTITLPFTGISAGRVRVTVRRADGNIYFSDCTVSSINLLTATPTTLNPANCTAAATLT